MRDEIASARLEGVPETLRDALTRRRDDLPAGAITAVGRFFRILKERGEDASAPSRGAFEAACPNESALGLLLRVLGRHAPSVGLTEGRALLREHYRRRAGGPGDRVSVSDAPSCGDRTEPHDWPSAWLNLLPALHAAPISDQSIDRHIASINRCAAMAPSLRCPPRLGWLFAWELSTALLSASPGGDRSAVTPRTAATYVRGLVSLARHGGLEKTALDGLRSVRAHLLRQGRRVPKKKQGRIEELYAKGGYEEVMLAKLAEADKLPDWSAQAETARATAAILAVCMNDPARTGDVAAWRFGEDLVREPTGRWRRRWRQGKTGHWKEAGELWPETGRVLDEHLLGGRPFHHAHRRYSQLRGANWLTFAEASHASRWPSEKVKGALGVPLHDMRTLVADYLRLHDPVTAPRIVSVLLGHRSQDAGREYQALCADTAAQRGWWEVRTHHAGGASRRIEASASKVRGAEGRLEAR